MEAGMILEGPRHVIRGTPGSTGSVAEGELVTNAAKFPGVDPTGVTDSTAGLQAAINAAPYGSTVLAPPGIYKFSNLTVDNGKRLVGAGWKFHRDALGVFGAANYGTASFFGGTVFRSTATSGVAITVRTTGVNTNGALADFILIGPGSGTSTGLYIGNATSPGVVLNADVDNVMACNFATGAVLAYVEEGRFRGLGARGCTLGFSLLDNTNNNTFDLLDFECCVTGLTDTALCIANVFVNPVGQANTGTSMVLRGISEQLIGGYFENVASTTGWAVDIAGGNGNTIQGVQLTKTTDGLRVQAAAHNTRIIVPTAASAIPISNAGASTYLAGDFATSFTLTDTGSHTIVANTGTGTITAETVTVGKDAFTGAVLAVNGAAGSGRQVTYRTAGVNRWITRAGAGAEAGANAGSDFEIVGRDDSGGNLHTTSVRRTDGQWTFPANIVPKAVAPVGLTGATTASRYVGGTPSGPPTAGTFAVGDFVITADGQVITCTAAGTPGTWRRSAGLDDWLVVTDRVWGSDPFGTNPKAALAAATAGQTVYFPPGTYTNPAGIGSGYTVLANNVTVLAGPGVTINVTTWGQPGIDCIGCSGVQIGGGLTVAFTGTRGGVGSSYRGSNGNSNGCGVYFNKDRCRVHGLRTVGMPVGVYLSSWNGTSSSDRMGVNNNIDDLEVEGGDFGVLWVGQRGLKIDSLYVHDDQDSSAGTNPTHAYYCAGNTTLGSTDLSISNVRAENILTGQAFQLKFSKNVRLSNHSARNCMGLINLISIEDLQWDGMGGVDMLANSGQGALTIQVGTGANKRLSLHNTSVAAATGVDERMVRIRADDSEVVGMLVTTSRPATPANASDYEVIVNGSNTRYKDLTIRSRGAGHVRAINSDIPGAGLNFEDFVCESTVGLVDITAGSTGVTLRYNPAAQQSIVTGSNYIGTLGGSADYSVSRSEYERAVTVASGSTSPRPNPYLETRTYLNVTDSSNFTVTNPSGGTPNVGTMLEVVVANNSGGTLGTVTWDTAYTLLTTYIKPASGKVTTHRFRHNGTTYVEITPVVAPSPLLTVTGLTGAVTQARFVGGTVSGAPVTGTFAVNDYVVSGDGNFYLCTVAGTPGTWVASGTPAALNALAANALTAGEIVPGRDSWTSGAVSNSSGTLSLAYFTADKTESITTLTLFTGSTAAAATPTLIRYGVYSVAGNGDLTLVASTPNDTTLLAATNTAYPKLLSVAWGKVVGQRYAVGPLVVSGATMPSYHGLQLTATGVVNTMVRLAPATIGRITGQTDLPSSIAAGSLSGYQIKVAVQMS